MFHIMEDGNENKMVELKEEFDVTYLSDKELGINSGKTRPCVIIKIDIDDGDENYVIPLTTKGNNGRGSNSNKLLLSNGSYLSLNNKPIRVDSLKIKYGQLSDIVLSQDDILEIEENF